MTNTTAPALGDQVRIVSDYSTTAGLADRVGVVVEVDERTAGVQYPGVRWVQHAPHAEIVVAAPAPAAVTIPARDLVLGDTILAEHDGGTERGQVQAAVEQRHDVGPAVRAARHADAVARLLRDLDDARPDEAPTFLLEHLAEHGPDGLDVQGLAARVLDLDEAGR